MKTSKVDTRHEQARMDQNFKAELRKSLRQRRARLNATTRMCLEGQINHHLLAWLSGRPEQKIAAYWPVRGEVDIRPALKQLSASERQLYLPRVDEQQTGQMQFVPWDPSDTQTELNRYGIPEPANVNPCSAENLDLILAPLVAFCPQGGRLGAGAGYYDRACAKLDRQRTWFVGLAYGFQSVEGLPQEPWDISLDGIITEQGIIACNERLAASLHQHSDEQERSEWPTGS